MSVACGHCGAGRSYLIPVVEALASGERLQRVKCLCCGWSIERPAPAAGRQITPVPATPRRRRDPLEYAPCPVVTCPREYVPTRSKTGLCHRCGHDLRNWEARRQRNELAVPPFLVINGFWFRRRQALVVA